MKILLYRSSVYSCHLFLISPASVRSIPFLSFYQAHLCMKCSLGISNFLEEISIFPILLFSSISLHWSLRKSFLSLHAVLWNSAFKWVYLSFSPLPLASLLFSAIYKASSDNHFAFLHFFFLGMFWSPPPVKCCEPPSIVLHGLYQILSFESVCHLHSISSGESVLVSSGGMHVPFPPEQ